MRVSLSIPWKEWFRYIDNLRNPLHLARSKVAVLATNSPASLRPGQDHEPLRHSKCGLFSPNLAEYVTIDAIREPLPDQPRYSLEIQDGSGNPTTRIVIPPAEASRTFPAFVRTYQTPRNDRQSWFSLNHASSTSRRQKIAGRIPWLRHRFQNGDPDVTPVSPRHLENVINQCIATKRAIRTTIYNQSLILGARWTPKHREVTQENCGNLPIRVTRYFGDQTGLELLSSSPTTVWLWTGTCNCCSESRWALEVGSGRDELALAVHSGDTTRELSWQNFLIGAISAV